MPIILLKENQPDLIYSQDKLVEAIEAKKPLVFENVILQRADTENHNHRIYPKNILEKEIENYKTLIREKRALCEIDHPETSIVSLKNACWLITDIWWDNLEVRGNIKVIDDPFGPGGRISALIKSGATIGVSSRALGEIEKDSSGKVDVVQEGLVIVSFDAVAEPSTHRAFVNPPAITESIDKLLEMNEHFSREYRINRMINNLICGKDKCDM